MIKSSNIISREIYRQLDSLATISQEEIELLYEIDGISENTIDSLLNYIYDNLLDIIGYGRGLDVEEESLLDNLYKNVKSSKIKINDYFEIVLRDVITRFNKISNNIISNDEIEKVFKLIESNKNKEAPNEAIIKFIYYLTTTIKRYKERREDKFNSTIIVTKGIRKRERVYPTIETRNKVFLGTVNLLKIYSRIYYKKLGGRVEYDDIFQTASEALLSACHYYIPTNEAKFTTYASRCIENKLRREYFKKKRKKKNTIGDEKIDTEYATMYFDSLLCSREYHGKRYYSVRETGAIDRLNRKIRRYNSKFLDLGCPEKVKITASRRYSSRTLESIFNIVLNLVETGKISMIISDTERSMLEAASDHLKLKGEEKRAWLVVEYLKMYQKKLMDIELYLETEKELMDKSDGVVPTREEIIKELNKKVKNFNSKLYSYRNNSELFPYLKSRKSYLEAYKEEMGVRILSEPEDSDSRAKEKKMISESWEALLYHYDEVLDDLDMIVDEDSYVYYSEEEDIDDYGVMYQRIIISELPEEGQKMTVSEAIRIVEEKKEALEDNEEGFIKEELTRRKDIVNKALAIYNQDIFEYNRSVIDEVEIKYEHRYRKKYNEAYIREIESNIEVLYCDDEGFLELVENEQSKKAGRKTLEEEVCNNEFLKVYYEALEKLTPLQKEILLRYYDEEGKHSYQASEIAYSLGIEKSKVYNEKKKAIRKLKKNQRLKSYIE